MNTSKTRKVTLKDVAKASGLSCATVSRALNNAFEFPESTRKRVWDAANALNYTPNSQARNLRAGNGGEKREKSRLVMHISHLGAESPIGNAFEERRSLMMAWEAEKNGLFMVPYWYYHRKGFQCPPLLNGHIDGAIVGTPHMEVVEILKEKIPTVLMDVPFSPETADVPVVNLDLKYGALDLMRLLRTLNHRRVGIVHSTYSGDGTSMEVGAVKAMRDAMEKNDLLVPEGSSITEMISPENHDEVMLAISKRFAANINNGEITAVLAPNMSCAVSLYENLTDMGLRVPEDVSIAGLNSAFSRPYDITSIIYDWEGLIETAISVLKGLIEERGNSCREFLVPSRFHEGGTVGKVK